MLRSRQRFQTIGASRTPDDNRSSLTATAAALAALAARRDGLGCTRVIVCVYHTCTN
jgi:hypothetical protein